jgi:hypothetical protein
MISQISKSFGVYEIKRRRREQETAIDILKRIERSERFMSFWHCFRRSAQLCGFFLVDWLIGIFFDGFQSFVNFLRFGVR